jgi:hypothetical protein
MLINLTFAKDSGVALEFLPVIAIGEQAKLAEGPNGEPVLELKAADEAQTLTLVICEHPKISSPDYKVRGQIKYRAVAGDGYLELLSDFGKEGTYFTRSLGEFGPLRKIKGTSDWHEFELPFHANPGMKPERLTLNIVLPGECEVTVTQPVLEDSHHQAGEWWSVGYSGIIGGIFGSLFGMMGGLLGMLMYWSQTRPIVKQIYPIVWGASLVVLILGIVALGLGQPNHVYFPIMMIGFIGSLVLSFNYNNVFRRIEEDELRKMTAIDTH